MLIMLILASFCKQAKNKCWVELTRSVIISWIIVDFVVKTDQFFLSMSECVSIAKDMAMKILGEVKMFPSIIL